MPVAPSTYAMAQCQWPDLAAPMKKGSHHPRNRSNPGDISRAYLRQVSTGLSFTEDVVKERSYSSLPYDKKYLLEALDISHIVTPPSKSHRLLGRHNPSLSVKRHLSCNLKPLGKKVAIKAAKLHEDVVHRVASGRRKDEEEEEEISSVFLTDVDVDRGKKDEWDKHLVALLSQPTAEWIVHRHLTPGEHQDDLVDTLEQRYGAMCHSPELIRDCVSEEGMSVAGDEERRQEGKKWKKGNETLLDRVRELTERKGQPTDPYCDDTGAAFYRLPAGIRRAQRQQQQHEDGAINRTARDVEVVPFLPPPPPSLRQSLHPGVGSKVFETTNPFQQERLIGVQQVRGLEEGDREIVLETQNHYRKQLQETTPRDPDTWFPQTPPGSARRRARRPMIGVRHWTSLPQLIQFDYANASTGSSREGKKDVPIDTGGLRDEIKSADPNGQRKAMANNTLLEIVNDWRTKWNLDMRYADATPEDLIRDMADIHVHIRLKAITTCARAAEYRPPAQLGIHLDKDKDGASVVKLLPEELFVALECCLDDQSDQVKRAAAITLYTLERPVPKAEVLLRCALREAVNVDRWAAAQCLAYYGECDSEVVGELIRQLLNSTDRIHREQASHLLTRLSENSTLVHSMLAEQLNSSSWRHRVMTCSILPKLQGNINKDIVNKLLYLMWNDWHKEVRKVAAQSLGRTGHGKAVHDELLAKISRGAERSKLEALNKLGHLGIMTAKLLPPFLECFHSNYVSVRMEACIACSLLAIREESVIDSLIYLTTYDGVWKVKALALQALGKIGVMTQSIRDCVLWAFRYEKVSGVRAEACHSIIALHMTDKEVIQWLQDRYLVEPSDVVKEEIITALEMCDISPTEDMDMVTQIKNEVTKMCTRNNICRRILVSEKEEARQARMSRLIYHAKKTVTVSQETPKETAAKDHVTTREKTTLSVDVTSRPSSHEVAAADREVQTITARSQSTSTLTESRTTVSLSGKSRHTAKTSKSTTTSSTSSDEGSETESDVSTATSRRSTTSQLAETAMVAARDKSERRREHRKSEQVPGGEGAEETMSGGDAGVTTVVGDEKTTEDDQELLPEDTASNVIAYFFQRYDNIGIPDEDDLARMWDEPLVRAEHFPATVKDTETTAKPCPVEMGCGDDGHKTTQAPVDKEAEVTVGTEVVRADMVTVSEGDGRPSVDGGQPQSEHDQLSARDSDVVADETGVKDDSTEVVESDKQETPDVTDRDSPHSETPSDHVDVSGDIPKRQEESQSADTKVHWEAEPDTTNGCQEEQTSDTEGHEKTKPDISERHEDPESIAKGGQQGSESHDSEEHQESEPNATEGKQETDSGQIETQQEAESNEIEGDQETETAGSEGRHETETAGSEGRHEAEPLETDTEVADEQRVEIDQPEEAQDTDGRQVGGPEETS